LKSLAKEGASVVGIDPTEEMIKVAKTHLPPAYQDQVDYIQTTVETMSSDHFGSYDVVVASEVIQHVQNPKLFLKKCCKMIKVKFFGMELKDSEKKILLPISKLKIFFENKHR